MEQRTCLECGEPVYGRIDKKFCSDQCRNAYNNRKNSDDVSYVQNINRTLRKNRRILKELNPDGKAKVNKTSLTNKGFNFKHFTHIYKNKEGRIYYFCYEYGYLPIDHDYFALVINKKL